MWLLKELLHQGLQRSVSRYSVEPAKEYEKIALQNLWCERPRWNTTSTLLLEKHKEREKNRPITNQNSGGELQITVVGEKNINRKDTS